MPLIISNSFRRLLPKFWADVTVDNPKYHFKLSDVNSPILEDISGGVESLAATASVTYNQPGQVEDKMGIGLNGIDSYASGTGTGVATAYDLDLANVSGIALEAIVYMHEGDSHGYVMYKGNSGINSQQHNYTMRILKSGQLRMDYRDTGNAWVNVPAEMTVVPNKWQHIFVNITDTGSGWFIDFYINGVLANVSEAQGAYPWNVTSTPLVLGAEFNNTQYVNFFPGVIDEAIGYEHELTTTRIQKHFVSTGIPVPVESPTPYLPNITYETVGALDNAGAGIQYQPDGLVVFIVYNTGILAFTLGAAWDISTIGTQLPTGAWLTGIDAFKISRDGTKIMLAGFLGDGSIRLRSYNIPTPWDLSSKVLLSGNVSVPTVLSTVDSLEMNDTGTNCYILGAQTTGTNPNILYTFGMGTSYDLVTLYDVQVTEFNVQNSNIAINGGSMVFKDDGFRFYILDATSKVIHEYLLYSPWQIFTKRYVGPIDISGTETTVVSMTIKPDGSKIYTVGSTAGIRQYSITGQEPKGILFTPNTAAVTFTGNAAWLAPPDGSSYIWDNSGAAVGTPPKWLKFQKLLVLASTTNVEFKITVDNFANLYVDDEFLGDTKGNDFNNYTIINKTLAAGTYRVLLHAENGGTADNPGGVAMSIRDVDLSSIIDVTDNTWTWTNSGT